MESYIFAYYLATMVARENRRGEKLIFSDYVVEFEAENISHALKKACEICSELRECHQRFHFKYLRLIDN